MGEYTTIQQHEPLRVPDGWGTQEKRFVVQLEELLDDLYKRFNRLTMSDLGKELQNIIKSDHASIEVINDTVTMTAGEGMSIGSVSISQTGISLSGGIVDMKSNTSMSIESNGLVDINGSTGSIVLGNGSVMNATSGSFDDLTVAGVLLTPIIYSRSKPELHKVLWAEPHYTPSLHDLDVTYNTYIRKPREEATHAFNGTYGNQDNKREIDCGTQASDTTDAASIEYTLTVPIILPSGADATKEFHATVQRSTTQIQFPNVTKTFTRGVVTNVVFTITSSTNLTAFSSGYLYKFKIWINTNNSSGGTVYLAAGKDINFRVKSGNDTLTDDECTIHYIP